MRIDINIPGSPYAAVIQPGCLAQLGSLVSEVCGSVRAMVIVDAAIASTHGAVAARSLEEAGFALSIAEMNADETTKSLTTVRRFYDEMMAARLERRSPVIALGGGIVGDTAGFAAATFLRGLPLVLVPSTLLAMVDASIGGKTGVNLELAGRTNEPTLGKNLVGAFCQPCVVIADPAVLRSLDERHFRCGLAECIKHALIADASLLNWMIEHRVAIDDRDAAIVSTLIQRCVAIKAAIVERDERESGDRALLNLGHTFAHALEAFHQLDLLHGEAVALGLCAAAFAALRMKRINEAEADAIETIVSALGLPTKLAQRGEALPSVDALMSTMLLDKKVADGKIHLILPHGLGRAIVASDVPESIVRAAWAHLGARG